MQIYKEFMERGPDEFVRRKGGAMQCAFMDGYEGNEVRKHVKGSVAWAAFMAGKDWKAQENKKD